MPEESYAPIQAELEREKIQRAVKDAMDATANAHLATDKVREAQMLSVMTKALENTFNLEDSSGQKRFLDITRVPLICQSIVGIHQSLEDIKKNMVSQESFWPVKTIVYGGVGIILTAVMTALVYLVVNH